MTKRYLALPENDRTAVVNIINAAFQAGKPLWWRMSFDLQAPEKLILDKTAVQGWGYRNGKPVYNNLEGEKDESGLAKMQCGSLPAFHQLSLFRQDGYVTIDTAMEIAIRLIERGYFGTLSFNSSFSTPQEDNCVACKFTLTDKTDSILTLRWTSTRQHLVDPIEAALNVFSLSVPAVQMA